MEKGGWGVKMGERRGDGGEMGKLGDRGGK